MPIQNESNNELDTLIINEGNDIHPRVKEIDQHPSMLPQSINSIKEPTCIIQPKPTPTYQYPTRSSIAKVANST